MNNFWTKLKKPIYALAPMAGITDSAFRQMAKEFGADVVYSEMASATALVYNPKKTLEMLASDKKEVPYVIQLFGSRPEHFAKAVKLIIDKKTSSKFQVPSFRIPDGIDINFGCPVKKVQKQGAGAILMTDLKLSRKVIESVLKNTDRPVSIKIRAGAGKFGSEPPGGFVSHRVANVTAIDFLEAMSDLPLAAAMIHGRTMAQGFAGEPDFEIIKKARDYFGGVILANGGVVDAKTARELLGKTGADGLGIARGALGRPWIFKEIKIGANKNRVVNNWVAGAYCHTPQRGNKEDIFKIALKHAKLAYKLKGEVGAYGNTPLPKGNTGVIEMRKHLCWYVTGLPNAAELRRKLVAVSNLKDVENILLNY